jgi:light-regulated signal transduction histidine kinase (bacteriophytochrome)
MSVDEDYIQLMMCTLAHDLGGAMRAASGFSQLLMDQHAEDLDEKALYWLSLIKNEGEKAQKCLKALSRYARLYGIEDVAVPCDLHQLCEKALLEPDYLDVLSEPESMTVALAPMPVISGYERLWVVYFSELLSNSAKYNGRQGEAVCKVFAEESDTEVRIIVEDNGVGLTPVQAKKAVLPYRTVDVGVGEESGVGMGLSFAKRIVELHGGEFALESMPESQSGLRVLAILPK